MAKKKFGFIVALGAIAGSAAWIYKKYDSVKSMYQKVLLFKGERIEFDDFEGEAIASMFSGVLIDLSASEFTEAETYLDLYGFCSGIRVLIPKDIEVVLEGTKKASGIQLDQDDDVHKSKTLYINYNLVASGLSISDNIDSYHDEHCCDDEDCNCDDEACCDDEDCSCDDEACCDDEDCNCDDEADTNDEDYNGEDEAGSADEEYSSDDAQEDNTAVEANDYFENGISDTVLNTSDAMDALNEALESEESEPDFDKLNQSVQELDQAALDVEEAIEQFVSVENNKATETMHNDEDDFFES